MLMINVPRQDAVLAAQAGVDGILISNHGGQYYFESRFENQQPTLWTNRQAIGIVSGHYGKTT